MQKQIQQWLISKIDRYGFFSTYGFLLILLLIEIPLFLYGVIFVADFDIFIVYIIKIILGYGLFFMSTLFFRSWVRNPFWHYGLLIGLSEFYLLVLSGEFIPELVLQQADRGQKINLYFQYFYTAHLNFFGFWFWLFPFLVAWVLAAYAEIEARKIRNPDKDNNILDD